MGKTLEVLQNPLDLDRVGSVTTWQVTCTDGGWVRPEARWPEVSIDIPVGAMRAYEFEAKHLGD